MDDGRPIGSEQPADLVMADLLDALIRERLCGFADGTVEGDEYRVGWDTGCVRFRVRPGGALQRWRYAGGPVRHDGQAVTAAELVRLATAAENAASRRSPALHGAGSAATGNDAVRGDVPTGWPAQNAAAHGAEGYGPAEYGAVGYAAAEQVAADLGTAGEHAAIPAGAGGIGGDPELLAAARGRPFHPTARAVVGWNPADLLRYGRSETGLDWLAVHTGHLRFGETRWDAATLPGAPAVARGETLVPVHPWHLDHVLRTEFAEEFAAGKIRVAARGTGRWRPTSSVRTLAPVAPGPHVKLPLGVNTLGSARLLPPRYLDNGRRGERLLRDVVAADPELAELVAVADETTWCGWSGDPYADRPGLLAAQLRRYPADAAEAIPMGAFAATEYFAAHPVDPATFFRELATGFCAMAVGFLCHGALPEIHGQNVLLAGGRFVLRDHDTVRYCPAWLSAPDPGYLVKPGASQSLRLDDPAELAGYLQTLGIQVNLYGIIDALSHHHGIPESRLWTTLRDVLDDTLDRRATTHRGDPATRVRVEMLRGLLLEAPTWPSREVLRPLLHRGRSNGVSMPAATGTLTNPFASLRPRRP